MSAFDSCKSRLPSCAISILLLPESFTDLKDLYNWLYFSKHWFNYTQEASHDLGRGSINGHQLFHVLVSHHSNKIFSLIYAKNSYTGTIGLHNFGAIYASRDAIEFCVQQDSQQFDLSLQKCKIKDGNIHEMFVNLSRPPTYWDVDPSHNSGYNELFNISISSPEHIRNMISDAANETLRYGGRLNAAVVKFGKIGEEAMSASMMEPTHPLLIEFRAYQFLTCYSKKSLTFQFYITPFQPALWVWSLSFIVLVACVTSLFKKYGGIQNLSFPPWLFILATLFEEPGFTPAQIEKGVPFRLILGSWCLMAVVLTNCYNGIMIGDLNSPLPGTAPKTFADLQCQDQYRLKSNNRVNRSEDILNIHTYDRISMQFDINLFTLAKYHGLRFDFPLRPEDFGMAYAIKSCFSLLSPRKKDIYWNKSSFTYSFDFFHFLRDRLEFDLKYVLKIQLQSLPKFIRTTFNLFLPVHSHTPEGFPRTRNESNDINLMTTLVEKEITKCGKSVYVALTDRFEAEYDFLRRKHRGIRFHKGDDAINSQPYGYSFKSSGISKVPRCYRSLLESGIHTIVVQNEWREIHRKRKPCRVDDVAKESLLGGGLITLFMICGVLIACAVCAAAFENQNVIWAYIVNLYVFIRANIITSSFSVGNKKTRVLWVHYKS